MKEKPKPKEGILQKVGRMTDRIIGIVSPESEFRRSVFRSANHGGFFSRSGGYSGAKTNRLNQAWLPGGASADQDLLPDLDQLRERSRDLSRNNEIANGVNITMVSNIVGHGISPQSTIDFNKIGIEEKVAEDLRQEIESVWDEWQPWADTAERMSFWQMQQLALLQTIMNGEVIMVREFVDAPYRPYGLAFNVVEGDRLDTPSDKRTDGSIRRGVELGSRGQPVAYWICKTHPGDMTYAKRTPDAKNFIRIPVRSTSGQLNVIHRYWVKRPELTRGEPFFAPVLNAFNNFGEYIDTEMTGARIAASLALLITNNNPLGSAIGRGSQVIDNKRIEEFENGMVKYLAQGESVQVVSPNRPGQSFDSFTEKLLRFMGAGLGLPYELILKDFSKTNYSSARAALLEVRKFFKCYQLWLAEGVCQPTWNLLIEEANLRGKITLPDFYKKRDLYTKAKWISPGWGHVDPEKEINASILAIENNLSTLADECAMHGRDYEDVLKQRAREKSKEKELGLEDRKQTTGIREQIKNRKPEEDEA